VLGDVAATEKPGLVPVYVFHQGDQAPVVDRPSRSTLGGEKTNWKPGPVAFLALAACRPGPEAGAVRRGKALSVCARRRGGSSLRPSMSDVSRGTFPTNQHAVRLKKLQDMRAAGLRIRIAPAWSRRIFFGRRHANCTSRARTMPSRSRFAGRLVTIRDMGQKASS